MQRTEKKNQNHHVPDLQAPSHHPDHQVPNHRSYHPSHPEEASRMDKCQRKTTDKGRE